MGDPMLPPGASDQDDYFDMPDANGAYSYKWPEEPPNQRAQVLSDVRGLVGWLEAHPDVPLPLDWSAYASICLYSLDNKDEAEMLAKQFGSCTKEWNDQFLHLKKRFGLITLDAVFSRANVCERVVVGTEELPETVIPERVEPARVVEKVEWRCSPILANGEKSDKEAA